MRGRFAGDLGSEVLGRDVIPHGWIQTSGGATPSINDQYGADSVTDVGVGLIDINWNAAFGSGEYTVLATVQSADAIIHYCRVSNTTPPAATVTRIVNTNGAGTAVDPSSGYHVIAFGV